MKFHINLRLEIFRFRRLCRPYANLECKVFIETNLRGLYNFGKIRICQVKNWFDTEKI